MYNQTHRFSAHRFPRGSSAVMAALFIASCGAFTARAQDPNDDAGSTTAQRDWSYSSRGPTRSEARASDPNRSAWDQGSWYASISAGPAWFGGDNMSNSTGFALEGRVARDLTDEVYLLASYTFALAESKPGPDSFGGDEHHDLHAFAFGVGFRFEVTPEVQFFVEPRAGVLFGSDADAAPVGMLSGGVEVSVTEGIAVRFTITGLVTDSTISRRGTDANVDSGVMGTFGVSFEF